MTCREKWVIKWWHPITKKGKRKTFYDEDKALKYMTDQINKGMVVKDTFYPCHQGKNGNS